MTQTSTRISSICAWCEA